MFSSSSAVLLALSIALIISSSCVVVNGQPPVNSTVDQGACCAPLGTNRKEQDNICKGVGSESSGLICVEEFCVDGTITDSCCVIPCNDDSDCPGEIHECRETGPVGNKRKGCTFGEFTDAFEKLCIAYPKPFEEALFPQRPLGTCCNKIDEIKDKPTLQNEWCGSLSGNRVCASKFCNGDDCCAIPCNNDNDCSDGNTCELIDGTRACTFNGSNGSCRGGNSFKSNADPPSSSAGGTVGGGGGGGGNVGGGSTTSGSKALLMMFKNTCCSWPLS